jgi:hypothetical protein
MQRIRTGFCSDTTSRKKLSGVIRQTEVMQCLALCFYVRIICRNAGYIDFSSSVPGIDSEKDRGITDWNYGNLISVNMTRNKDWGISLHFVKLTECKTFTFLYLFNDPVLAHLFIQGGTAYAKKISCPGFVPETIV